MRAAGLALLRLGLHSLLRRVRRWRLRLRDVLGHLFDLQMGLGFGVDAF